jgi:glycyl-tRNA synthetase beta chain
MSGSAALLVELLTEELPPKRLVPLAEAFARELFEALRAKGYADDAASCQPFATPRRLAVRVHPVRARQPDRLIERRGPAVSAALDAAGRPTAALLGFARSCGVEPERLERTVTDKGEYFVWRARQPGLRLAEELPALVEAALKRLPAPKLMRWGSGEVQFVRPVHGVVLLHGGRLVRGTVLGLPSGRRTQGHRFLAPRGGIAIRHADEYEMVLESRGRVIADHRSRMRRIEQALEAEAVRCGARWDLGRSRELVEEVASLVEYPAVYAGAFDEAFLEVPEECLIVSMQQHQRYFPLADRRSGKLQARFLFVSNIPTDRPERIIQGNERVLKARLSDARFFFEQDKKIPLAARVARLANVVFHGRLGSQLERVQRIEKLAGEIGRRLARAGLIAQPDLAHVERAATLCKADLTTEMVGEFPELQGIMGKYYARHDGEPEAVACAIEQHYWPRTAADALPSSPVAVAVALADRLDQLVGLFGIGLAPSGEKDPYGLRRAALGVVRLLVEKRLPLDVVELLRHARELLPSDVLAAEAVGEVHAFLLERLRFNLREQGFAHDEVEAVLALRPRYLDQVVARLEALRAFRARPEAEALTQANKRIGNILRQAAWRENGARYDETLARAPAEKVLGNRVLSLESEIRRLLAEHRYTEVLERLAELRPAVDEFFDTVLVMDEDERVRGNRLALLARLRGLFLEVADLSRLQG